MLAIFSIVQNRFSADTSLADLEESGNWERTCYGIKGYNFNTSSPAATFAKLSSCSAEAVFSLNSLVKRAISGRSRQLSTGKWLEQDDKLTVTQDSNGLALAPNTKYRLSFYLKVENRTCYDTQRYENGVYYDTDIPTTPTVCTPPPDGTPNTTSCQLACAQPTSANGNHNGINPFNCKLTSGFADPWPFKSSTTYPHAAWSPFCGDYDVLIRDPNQYPAPGTSAYYYKSVLPSRFLQATVKYKNQDWYYNTYEFTTLNNSSSIDIMVKQMGFTGNLYIDEMHLQKIDSFVTNSDMVTPVNFPGVMSIDAANSTPDTGGATVANPTFASNAAKFSFGTTNLIFAHKDNLARHLATIGFSANYLNNLTVRDEAQGVKVYENSNVRIAAAADSTAIIKLKRDMNLNLTGIPAAYNFYRNGVLFLRDTGTKKLADGTTTAPYGNGFFFSPMASVGDLNQFYYQVKNKTGQILDLVERNYRLNGSWDVLDANDNIVTGFNAANIAEYNPLALPELRKWTVPTKSEFTNGTWNIVYTGKAGDAYFMSIFPPKEYDYEKFCSLTATTPGGIIAPSDGDTWWAKSKQKLAAFSNFTSVASLWDYFYKCSDGNCPAIDNTNYSFDPHLETDKTGANTTLLQRYEASYGLNWKYDLQWPKELNTSAPWFQNVSAIREKLGLKDIAYKSPQYHLNFSDTTFVDLFNNDMLKQASGNYLIDGTYLDGPRSYDIINNIKLFRTMRNTISSDRSSNGMLLLHTSGNSMIYDGRAGEDNGKYPDGASFSKPFLEAYADLVWQGESLPFTSDDVWQNNYTGFGISNTPTQLLMEDRLTPEGSNPPMTNVAQQLKQLRLFGTARNITQWPNYYEGLVKDDDNKFNLNTYYRTWKDYCQPLTKNNNKCDFQESYLTANTDTEKNDCAPKETQSQGSSFSDTTVQYADSILSKSEKTIANWMVDNIPLFQLHYSFDDSPSNEPSLGIFTDSSGNKLDANAGGTKPDGADANSVFPQAGRDQFRQYGVFDGTPRLAGFHGTFMDSAGTLVQDKIPTLNMTGKSFSVFSLVQKNTDNYVGDHAIYVQDKAYYDPANAAQKPTIGAYVQDLTPSIYLGINDATSNKVVVKMKQGDGSQKVCTGQMSIDNTWHMIGFTFDRQNVQIYVDGEPDGGPCFVANALFDDTIFSIGSAARSTTPALMQSFVGNIDDIFVSKNLLSQTQIQTLMGDKSGGYLKKIFVPDFLNTNKKVKAILINGFRKYESSTPTISIRADKTSAKSGDIINYNLTYTNYSGEIITLSNLSNPIPANTTFVSNSSTGNIVRTDGSTRNINRNFANGTITWIFDATHPGTLNPGEKFIGTYQVSVN